MNFVTRILAAVVAASAFGTASAAEASFPLDPFPTHKLTDEPSLQNGAKLFVGYCLNCHSASLMRYNRLRDIGLTDEQIRDNLVLDPEGKVGDLMTIAMRPADARQWFGSVPPDLSVTARARSSGAGSGADWIYTYLRAYFRDDTRPHGWNNALFEGVGMPHALWELQGMRGATLEEIKEVADESGNGSSFVKTTVTFDPDGARTESTEKLEGRNLHASRHWTLGPAQGGTMTQPQFDAAVADLTAFLAYTADPSARTRVRTGVWVLLFLGVFTIFAWMLNREYWKDIK